MESNLVYCRYWSSDTTVLSLSGSRCHTRLSSNAFFLMQFSFRSVHPKQIPVQDQKKIVASLPQPIR
jgi:hypothetical protein